MKNNVIETLSSGKNILEPHEMEVGGENKEGSTGTNKGGRKKNSIPWTEEEDKLLFRLYKEKGSVWSTISKSFSGRSENNLKNRFYSTLRRIARKKAKGLRDKALVTRISHNLLDYVDEAIEYGHKCFCKRGRPKKYRIELQKNQDSVPDKPSGTLNTAFNPRLVPLQIVTPSFNGGTVSQGRYDGSCFNLIGLPTPYTNTQQPKDTARLNEKLVELINVQNSIVSLLIPQPILFRPPTV